MPTHSRTPASWRRFVPAIRATLVMALMLCAVIHGATEQTHASVPLPAAASVAVTAGGDPHGPHGPHGPYESEDCAADAIVRSAAPSAEDLPLGAMALVVLIALSVLVGRPLVRPSPRGRRSARTGRVALVRTSRWRI
ncbi:hypothetical protein [Streptomyces lanatus]|uniref:Secreted protein n=1 Tax=Streptomyces lanatus TaxID=66900 RepID=A0ABV1Y3H9_9ACTN|nr:hypothetical protein [Streptomyces lanatus]GHH26569.1 hypothetical protein GCM10018780_79980 [Streptomyces lanatus]